MTADLLKKARPSLPRTEEDRRQVERLLPQVHEAGERKAADSWGMLGLLGLNAWLLPIDDATRTPFMPYGLSGIMLGASIVFFAYIGFDSISTHAEEAQKSAARRAHRHSHLVAALHAALHGGGGRDDGHDALSGHRHQSADRRGFSRKGGRRE